MHVSTTDLPGVLLIQPDVHRDVRGYFLETYNADKYRAAGIPGPFVQDNHSRSVRDTIRGLHFQRDHPQGKLIRVVVGEIWDVAVDVRRGSPTFARFVANRLSAERFTECYIPPGFAHGFCVLSDEAHVEYKCTSPYDPADNVGIAWNDPSLAIPWPAATPILSDKDRLNPTLAQAAARLPVFTP